MAAVDRIVSCRRDPIVVFTKGERKTVLHILLEAQVKEDRKSEAEGSVLTITSPQGVEASIRSDGPSSWFPLDIVLEQSDEGQDVVTVELQMGEGPWAGDMGVVIQDRKAKIQFQESGPTTTPVQIDFPLFQ